jgi:TonB family protein
MSRLQKKCFIAASGFHLLLLLILMVGPAFLAAHTKKPVETDLPVLEFIPLDLTDKPFSGGGTPNVTPPPPAPPAPAPQVTPPAPVPQPPKPTFIEKLFPPDPPQPEKSEKPEKPAPEKPEVDPLASKKVVKPAPTVSLKKVIITAKNSNTSSKPVKKSDPEAEARAEQLAANKARAAAIGKSLTSLKNNLSSGTSVEIPGPGGAAYANYAQVVKSVYTQAWIAPDDVADDSATTKVNVTIARDGTVVSASIINPSGSGPVDRSVQQTLNRVKFVAPFPDGAKEGERSFIINFNLKAKRLIG